MKKKNMLFLIVIIGLLFFNMDVNAATVECGDVRDIPRALPIFTSNLINAIKVLIPVILIIMGMLDFGKAMSSNDDKAASESKNKFVRRVIAAVLVFLTTAIVQLVLGVLGGLDNTTLTAMNLFINGECKIVRTPYETCLIDANKSCGESCEQATGSTSSTEFMQCAKTCSETKKESCNLKYNGKCYQCNSDENVYKWAVSNSSDSSCSSGYHLINITTKDACHK